MNPNDIQIQMQSLNGSKQLDQLFVESEDLRLSKNNSDEKTHPPFVPARQKQKNHR